MYSIDQNQKKVNPFHEENLENFFISKLPTKPYCTNVLGSLSIKPKKTAIAYNYLQHNNINDFTWLVYDVDRSESHFDWDDLHCPPPNFAIMNRENGYSHLFYGLETSVYTQMSAKRGPLKYASAVDMGLTQKLNADKSYAGLISKNPLSDTWVCYDFNPYLYTLELLSEYIDIKKAVKTYQEMPIFGLGRNCTLFDVTRQWAYSAIRDIQKSTPFDKWLGYVDDYAQQHNQKLFNTPLSYREVKSIAASIAKWVFKRMSKEEFDEWGDARRKKSSKVRGQKAQERARNILDIKKNKPDMSNRAIARLLGIDEGTVRNAILNFKEV